MSTDTIAIGTIFESSWGYDQTNVDFYKVTGKTAKFITLQKVGSKIVQETGWAESVVIPGETEIGKPFKRKVQTFAWGVYVSISDYASASPWAGKPVRQSSYA
jgi:hypothetical protein